MEDVYRELLGMISCNVLAGAAYDIKLTEEDNYS
jgi:hypothetical protein